MKYLVGVILTLASVSGLAKSMQISCTANKTEITLKYVEKDVNGKPLFSYSNNGEKPSTIDTTNASEIDIVKSPIGTLITVGDQDRSVRDAANGFVSVIVPNINLDESYPQASFQTSIIETLARTTIAGESGVQGVVQDSHYYPAYCLARLGTK